MLKPQKIKKIALIGDSLSKGGAEKVQAVLSIYFEKEGFEVYNCILVDAITYKYSGGLLNLGKIKSNSSSIIRKIYRFQALRKWLKVNDFDCVIDFRMRPSFTLEFILSRFLYPKNTIYTVHSSVLEFYFPKLKFLAKLVYQGQKIVAVSNGVKQKIVNSHCFTAVKVIYNPLDLDEITVLSTAFFPDGNFILAIGSMDSPIKQVDKLIQSYSQSALPKQGVKLIILGDGKYKTSYESLVKNLNLSEFICLKGRVNNPYPYFKNALFYTLCSKNEGLPNVLIESLACGTPVISFNCACGPSEIITNNENGILVKDQDFSKLVEALNTMLNDTQLHQFCRNNSKKSSEKFSINSVGKQWIDFISA